MGVSVEASSGNDDLRVAMEGGQSFVGRLNQLAEATEALRKAREDFNLSNSAKEAYDDAARKHAAALEAQRDAAAKAQQTVEQAREESGRLIATAEARHKALMAEATGERRLAKEHATQIVSDAEKKAQALTGALEALNAEAEKKHAEATRLMADAEKKLKSVEALQSAAEAARVKVEERRRRLEAALAE